MNTFKFSMLELMAVILVIATLLTLLLPSMSKLYKNANTILCQKNLKDLHTLNMSYAADHNQVLPGYSAWDNVEFKQVQDGYENSSLYYYWNGHLAPYIDPAYNLSNYKRYTKIYKNGKLVSLRGGKVSEKTPDYHIFNGALKGEGIFNLFICTEVIQDEVYDPGINYLSNNNAMVPKMFNLAGGDSVRKLDHTAAFGIPTCYTANDYLFDGPKSEKKKISKIKNYGQKVMLMEGGNNTSGGPGKHEDDPNATPYIMATGENIDNSQLGYSMSNAQQIGYINSHFTFAHDNEEEFWYSGKGRYFEGDDDVFDKEKFNQFNDLFAPIAYTTPNGGTEDYRGFMQSSDTNIGTLLLSGRSMITHEDPNLTTTHTDAIKEIFGWEWGQTFQFISNDDVRTKSAIGNSNVLFADGTVKTKHASWIFTNRMELFSGF